MKASENTPETILSIMLKLSILYLLCIAVLNAPRAKGQTHDFRNPKPPINSIQQKVQQIYTSQIGIREKGTNAGVAVEQYLRYVNLAKGDPWCAAFVCWVYGKAGVGNPRTGWTPDLFRGSKVIWASGEPRTKNQESRPPQNATDEPRTRIQDPRLPQHALFAYPSSLTTNNEQPKTPSTGDVFGLYFPEKNRIAHVGFIDQWDGTWMVSVEGNTNVAGGREGDGVYRKRRLVRSVYKVARYIK